MPGCCGEPRGSCPIRIRSSFNDVASRLIEFQRCQCLNQNVFNKVLFSDGRQMLRIGVQSLRCRRPRGRCLHPSQTADANLGGISAWEPQFSVSKSVDDSDEPLKHPRASPSIPEHPRASGRPNPRLANQITDHFQSQFSFLIGSP